MFATRCRRRARSTAWAWLLAIALVGAQALGLVHALQHAKMPAQAVPVAAASGDDAPAHTARAHDAWGHASGTAACVLWSGLLGGDAAACDAPVHACAKPASLEPAFDDACIAPRDAARAYDARGPPAV